MCCPFSRSVYGKYVQMNICGPLKAVNWGIPSEPAGGVAMRGFGTGSGHAVRGSFGGSIDAARDWWV